MEANYIRNTSFMLRLALSLQSNRKTKHLCVFHCSPLINQHLEVKGSTKHFKPKRRVQSGLCTFPSYNALHNISDIYMSSAELTAAEALGSFCKHREHARRGHHIAFENVQRPHNKVPLSLSVYSMWSLAHLTRGAPSDWRKALFVCRHGDPQAKTKESLF